MRPDLKSPRNYISDALGLEREVQFIRILLSSFMFVSTWATSFAVEPAQIDSETAIVNDLNLIKKLCVKEKLKHMFA